MKPGPVFEPRTQFFNFLTAFAAFDMIIDEAHRLHMRIHRRWADKLQPRFFKSLDKRIEVGEVGLAISVG